MSAHAAAVEARQLLNACYDGVLSTLSVAVPGYPFGSVVPFCPDADGHPIILIANIAQHRKNLVADGKASLMVFDRAVDDLQSNGRLTLLADAEQLPPGERTTPERYYRYFPEATDYHLTHGFEFWRLRVRRLRFIGGFGSIHWLEPQAVLQENPFVGGAEGSMVAHMNADHVDAMRDYLRPRLGDAVDTLDPALVGVDREGIHIRIGQRIHRVTFPTPVEQPMEVRKALVALAAQVRGG